MELTFLPDGSLRGIWDDTFDTRALGLLPRRASRVEVIEDGPYAGEFHVDFSPLAVIVADSRLQVCLTQRFLSYKEAVTAEVVWLKQNWTGGYTVIKIQEIS